MVRQDIVINAVVHTKIDDAKYSNPVVDLTNFKAITHRFNKCSNSNIFVVNFSTNCVFDRSGKVLMH